MIIHRNLFESTERKQPHTNTLRETLKPPPSFCERRKERVNQNGLLIETKETPNDDLTNIFRERYRQTPPPLIKERRR